MASKIKFEDKMNRLQEIVDKLEDEDTQIDEALKLYEEGLALSKDLQIQLKGFEDRIKEISKEQ